jgi:hypothetical protein
MNGACMANFISALQIASLKLPFWAECPRHPQLHSQDCSPKRAAAHSTMSTIASPRVSSPVRSVSSSRTSLDAPAGRSNLAARRNRADRAALRDYYGLKTAEAADAASTDSARSPGLPNEENERSELDEEGFNVQGYVKNVLATKDLENVLRIEAGLMSGRSSAGNAQLRRQMSQRTQKLIWSLVKKSEVLMVKERHSSMTTTPSSSRRPKPFERCDAPLLSSSLLPLPLSSPIVSSRLLSYPFYPSLPSLQHL